MNASEYRATFALGSIFALRMLGLFMIVPVFSVYGATQYSGATPQLLGLAIGIYGMAQALLQVPFSLIADRVPRKPLIIFGLLLFALGGFVAATSTSIWGIIAGRALAGMGAVSAVVMALLSDVVREEQRTYAMAAMGMSIALSFIVAFAMGPLLTHWVGLSGLFYFTSIAALLAMGLLLLVPTPVRLLKLTQNSYRSQLKSVLAMGDLNRLHFSIFCLHLFMTAAFVIFPHQLIDVAHIPIAKHGMVYLPMMLLGFILAIPFIIIAESKRRMRRIYISAVILVVVAFAVLGFFSLNKIGLIVGMGIYIAAFNLIEALLPSWLSKISPIAEKSTAMGVNASSQFLGAGLGGALGGALLAHLPLQEAWWVMFAISALWAIIILQIKSPPYLSSIALTLPEHLRTATLNRTTKNTLTNHHDAQDEARIWTTHLLALNGVEDVVILQTEHVAYLKIDKRRVDDVTRQSLSQLIGKSVDF